MIWAGNLAGLDRIWHKTAGKIGREMGWRLAPRKNHGGFARFAEGIIRPRCVSCFLACSMDSELADLAMAREFLGMGSRRFAEHRQK